MMLLRGFLIAVILWFMAVILVASCTYESYANTVQHKAVGLALVGYQVNGAQSASSGFFVRNISMRSHVMAELEGEAFALASHLSYWSTNPFQLCHHNYLVVIGKAPTNSGAHSHA